jgi:hypothetical protein
VKPYHINVPERALSPGLQSNEVSIPYHNILVTGLRDKLHEFSLDRNGFKVVIEDQLNEGALCNSMQYEEYSNESLVRGKARKAVEKFLKKEIPGCEDAVAFSHQVIEILQFLQQLVKIIGGGADMLRFGDVTSSFQHFLEVLMDQCLSLYRVYTLVCSC